jgi:hypothetical protein
MVFGGKIDMRNTGLAPETAYALCAASMARTKWFDDVMQAKFIAGTFARIAAALRPSEDRTDFVREAVDRELKRRERTAKRAPPPVDQ